MAYHPEWRRMVACRVRFKSRLRHAFCGEIFREKKFMHLRPTPKENFRLPMSQRASVDATIQSDRGTTVVRSVCQFQSWVLG